MFSSTYDPFSFMNGETHQNPSLIPEITNQNQNPSPFSHFPIPFLDTDADGMLIMNHKFPQHPEQQVTNVPEIKQPKKLITTRRKRGISNGASSKMTAPQKRTGKKDRHSKIYTSQGPRDRRMRLSLPIARKFFDLQDMLGFDKASKTIEWLFTKSKAAIQEVTDNFPRIMGSCSGGNGKTISCTSESEVLSVEKEKVEEITERKLQKAVSMNCSSPSPSLPKESREKARARARERTKDKMKMKTDDSVENFQYSSSSTPIKAASDTCYRHKFQMVDSISDDHETESVSIIEKFLGITGTGARLEGYDQVFSDKMEMQYGFSGMGIEKEFSGKGIQVQNPNSFFMASSNTEEQNPNSVFMNHPSIQGSTSNADHFQENEFKYCGFY